MEWEQVVASSQFSVYAYKNKYICFVTIEGSVSSVAHGGVVASGLLQPIRPIYLSLTAGAGNYSAFLGNDGTLLFYYPENTAPSRIDAAFMYPVVKQ